ncbi:MAG: copper amine oxidase N-terminal domain-containing protein [Thermovenabulum sp.]|uniref:copper amine oxidase N-terminal domain-containing protein n=1 Tax=Thermovenabulum sp. TaxID=3100335 RepID=UPI003C7CF995
MKRKIIFMMASMLAAALILSTAVYGATKDIVIKIDGQVVTPPDAKPFIQNGRTLVPIRFVSENLGATVDYKKEYGYEKVYIKKNDRSIEMTIGDNNIKINSTVVTYEVAPIIKDDRTFVPVRVVSESLGYFVGWDEKTLTVLIDTQKPLTNTIIGYVGSQGFCYQYTYDTQNKAYCKHYITLDLSYPIEPQYTDTAYVLNYLKNNEKDPKLNDATVKEIMDYIKQKNYYKQNLPDKYIYTEKYKIYIGSRTYNYIISILFFER